jgi:hypothetical protein
MSPQLGSLGVGVVKEGWRNDDDDDDDDADDDAADDDEDDDDDAEVKHSSEKSARAGLYNV